MPETSFSWGPAVVVNLAESEFSGRRELRMEVRLEDVGWVFAAGSSLLGSLGMVIL